jgi:hypothetical protein
MLLTVPLSDGTIKEGLPMPVAGKAAPRKGTQHLGTLLPLSGPNTRNTQPRLACSDGGCFVAWEDEKSGASVAFIDKEKLLKIWDREFAPKGSSPALMTGHNKLQMTWFEDSRLKVAAVTRDGLSPTTVINRVSGYQPSPVMFAGDEPNEWVIAWRDYEAAHLEVFALRAVCQ